MNTIDTHTHFFPKKWVRPRVNEGPDNGATMGKNAPCLLKL